MEIEVRKVTTIPLFIIGLNRLARMGKASRYSPSKRLVQFDLRGHPFVSKFVGLGDVERITLVYKEDR